MLLVHGTGPGLWGEVPDLLEAAGLRVLSYDRRGFGSAPGPAGQDLSTHARDLATVIARTGSAPVMLLAWSVGGIIALEVAATEPDLVAGLVALEPPLHVAKGLNAGAGGLMAIGGAVVLGKLGRPVSGARRFASWALSRRDGGSDLDRLESEDLAALEADAAAMVAELEVGTGEHLDARSLSSIRCPVVWLFGDQSVAALQRAAQRAPDLVPGAVVVRAEGTGHAIALNRPDAVVEAVLRLATPARG